MFSAQSTQCFPQRPSHLHQALLIPPVTDTASRLGGTLTTYTQCTAGSSCRYDFLQVATSVSHTGRRLLGPEPVRPNGPPGPGRTPGPILQPTRIGSNPLPPRHGPGPSRRVDSPRHRPGRRLSWDPPPHAALGPGPGRRPPPSLTRSPTHGAQAPSRPASLRLGITALSGEIPFTESTVACQARGFGFARLG
jgi:hypothetical protein